MPARKPYKVDIDVIPYLSIMAIVLKLICLILIVMVMRIAVNPDAIKICRYPGLYQPPEETTPPILTTFTNTDGSTYTKLVAAEKQISRVPVYFDCHPDRIEIQPENIIIPLSEIREERGDFQLTLDDIEAHTARKLAVVITRPNSSPVYRYVRRQVAARKLKVGYDVLEADTIIDWPSSVVKFSIQKDFINAHRQAKHYDVPVATMTNWFIQAIKEGTNLAAIAERVKSGKLYNDAPRKIEAAPPKHH